MAKGFAVCDHWFASAPTQTIPNRAFAAAATSQGHLDNHVKVMTVPDLAVQVDVDVHTDGVLDAALSPDGSQLVVSGEPNADTVAEPWRFTPWADPGSA